MWLDGYAEAGLIRLFKPVDCVDERCDEHVLLLFFRVSRYASIIPSSDLIWTLHCAISLLMITIEHETAVCQDSDFHDHERRRSCQLSRSPGWS